MPIFRHEGHCPTGSRPRQRSRRGTVATETTHKVQPERCYSPECVEGGVLGSPYARSRTLTEAFNTAYEVAESRPGWKRGALSVAFGPVLALMVIVSVGLMLIGPRLVERKANLVGLDEVFGFFWGWLRFPMALSLLAVVLSVVYRFGPDAKQHFRSVVLGAALAVVLWAISSVGFSFYLVNFANYGVTYGSLGAAVGLLFYLYLSASVVLLGAEVNAAIYHLPQSDSLQAQKPGSGHETRDTRAGG
jgi:membrane protein